MLNNKKEEFSKKLNYLKEIINYMETYRDVLLLKDIIYTKISMFWNNIAFFNKESVKEEIADCYDDKFIKPVLEYLNKKNQRNSYQCIECGKSISSIKEGSMAWLNDVGVDVTRKRSNFWNFNPNALICPICRVVYSCIPLGFYMVGGNGLFVNSSVNIESLFEMNSHDIKMNSLVDVESAAYYKILRALNYLSNVELAKKQINFNIQIVKRIFENDKWTYKFNIVTPTILMILSEREKEFKQLLNRYYTYNKGSTKSTTINIYDETIKNILQNRNLYFLMNNILRDSIGSSQRIDFLYTILKIQISFLMKGVVGMERVEQINKLEKTSYYIMKCGQEIKNILAPIQGDGKNKSSIYKLLTALRVNNVYLFIDTAIRLFNDAKKEIPIIFVKMLNDESQFKVLGYAFVLGLLEQDDFRDKEDNNEDKIRKDGVENE